MGLIPWKTLWYAIKHYFQVYSFKSFKIDCLLKKLFNKLFDHFFFFIILNCKNNTELSTEIQIPRFCSIFEFFFLLYDGWSCKKVNIPQKHCLFFLKYYQWNRILKNGPSKFYGRQHLKSLKLYGLIIGFSFLLLEQDLIKRVQYNLILCLTFFGFLQSFFWSQSKFWKHQQQLYAVNL